MKAGQAKSILASALASDRLWPKIGRRLAGLGASTAQHRAQAMHSAKLMLAESVSNRLLAALNPRTVLGGIFSGMTYGNHACGSSLGPKLLGTYESELSEAIVELARDWRPTRVIDVGCAEGYYAVGLARMFPEATIYAFDIDERARNECLGNARENGVDSRIQIGGRCTSSEVADILRGESALVIMDCEGAEAELITDDLVRSAARSKLVIELHDFVVPGATTNVVFKFRYTHTVILIDAVESRRPPAYSRHLLDQFSKEEIELLMWENRPPGMRWLVCTPICSSLART